MNDPTNNVKCNIYTNVLHPINTQTFVLQMLQITAQHIACWFRMLIQKIYRNLPCRNNWKLFPDDDWNMYTLWFVCSTFKSWPILVIQRSYYTIFDPRNPSAWVLKSSDLYLKVTFWPWFGSIIWGVFGVMISKIFLQPTIIWLLSVAIHLQTQIYIHRWLDLYPGRKKCTIKTASTGSFMTHWTAQKPTWHESLGRG